jgi:hypothetical protein
VSLSGGTYHVAVWQLLDEKWWVEWLVPRGGRAAEWHLLLNGSRSSAGSGGELDENDRNVCVWLLRVAVTRRTEGVVTGCLASPGPAPGQP